MTGTTSRPSKFTAEFIGRNIENRQAFDEVTQRATVSHFLMMAN